MTREEVELYMMGEYDGDKAALETALADDPALRAIAAEEAELEMLLRDAGTAAVFCAGCGDLAGDERCDACGAAIRPGGYIVERVLVSNAHGRMYVARDADGKQVALKELAFVQTPSLDTIAMFEREAKFLRALEHPAIPRFVASFEEGTGVHARYYLAQELVTGVSLEKRLEDHFYTEAEIIDLARQVLDVLAYLQTVSPMVIHRDIKPANLIAKPDGKIAVVDFGAAHVQGTTAGSTSIGTFGYMPIEQLAGQVDATTDAYALGASLLHLLSRREPWRILQGVSLEGINVSPSLRAFLSKLVATEPAQRFANATAALDGLEQVSRGDVVNFDDHTKKKARRAGPRWLPPLAMAAAGLALAAGGFGVHALVHSAAEQTGYGKIKLAMELGADATLTIDKVPYGRVQSGFTATVPTGSHVVELTGCPTFHTHIDEGSTLLLNCHVDAETGPFGRVDLGLLGTHHSAQLFIDGYRHSGDVVHNGHSINLPTGSHTIKLVAANGARCEQELRIETGKQTKLECTFGPGGPGSTGITAEKQPLPAGKPIDLDFKATSLHDVLRGVGDACGLSVVAPDSVDAKITIRLKQAPCDQALEVLLESHGLWYRYSKAGNIVRIAPRNELDREAEAQRARTNAGMVDDVLPTGTNVDLDFKQAELRDLLAMLASMKGINVVVPGHIDGKVTVKLHKTPWDVAVRTILETKGLWYRYRPNGKLLRVAPRNQLDREAEAAKARDQLTR